MPIYTRLSAWAANGDYLGPLPTPQDYQASYVLNDTGVLTLKYPPRSPLVGLLGQPIEVVLQVSRDGVSYFEPYDSRFLYLRDGRDPLNDDAWSVECPGYLNRLKKAVVGGTNLDGDGKRTFRNTNPGQIMHTLLTEAQGRGALVGFSWNFTGQAWSVTVRGEQLGGDWGGYNIGEVSYQPGRDLLSIVQELAAAGYVDFRAKGRQMDMAPGRQLSRPGAALLTRIMAGRDFTETPFRRTWENLADTVLVQGENNTFVTRRNASALQPWGPQEGFVSATNVSDAGTLAVVGDASLSLSAGARTEFTHGLTFRGVLPFADYALGERLSVVDLAGGVAEYVVRQVTLTRDTSSKAGGSVVLNDRFAEADVITQRRLDAITNGSVGLPSVGGSGTGGIGPDILAPAGVVSLSSTSTAYAEGGVQKAQVSLTWPAVTTNADGTTLSDLNRYEVQSKRSGDSTWLALATSGSAGLNASGLATGVSYDFRVRAVDNSNNAGSWSPIRTQVTAGTASADDPTAWKPWTIQNTEGVAFNTDYVARYARVGNTIHAKFWGSVASGSSGAIKVNLPVPVRDDAFAVGGEQAIGTGMAHVPGTTRYMLLVTADGINGGARNGVSLWVASRENSPLATTPSGSRIGFSVTYEAAP